jgi:dCTP diphosphatase
MDVKAIQARLAAHAVERNWDPFFSPRSLSMAVAGEAGTLVAVFQWLSEDQARRLGKTPEIDAVAESIADIVLYALRLAETVDVDLERAVLARAAEKYPVSARRFEELDEQDSLASPPAPREAVRAVPAPRHVEPETVRPSPRAAPVRDEPPKPAPPISGRAQPASTPQDDPEPPSRGRSEPAPRERAEPPPRARAEPPPRAKAEPPARERAAPPTRAEPPARPEPPPRAAPPPREERYAKLDTDAVLDLIKGLKKRIDDSRSDEAVLHEVKDEIDTLRRNVYSSKTKPAWIAGGLERLRALLEEVAAHPVGEKVNFKDYIARITGMLEQ